MKDTFDYIIDSMTPKRRFGRHLWDSKEPIYRYEKRCKECNRRFAKEYEKCTDHIKER